MSQQMPGQGDGATRWDAQRPGARPGTVYRARPGWRRALASAVPRTSSRRRPTAERAGPGATGRPAPGLEEPVVTTAEPAPSRTADPAPSLVEPAGVRRGRRRRWPWLVAVVVVVLVGYPLALGATAWSSVHRTAMAASRLPDTPGRTWLVVGSDSREGLSKADKRRLHTGSAGGRRTDTIMLLHVPDGDGPVALVSIPRDSYVAIPGHGKNKINAAFAFGGPQLLARTIEQATGVRIDSYAETGLGGFADVVDTLGGVDVCVRKAFSDAEAHISLRAGCQRMDGPTALGYARARHSQARGDLDRVDHQRQVLAAIASRAFSPAVLVNPFRAFPAASSGGGALTVDDDVSPGALIGFARAMRAVAGGDGVQLTVPVARADLRTPAGAAVAWDATKARAVFAALNGDDTARLRSFAAEQSAR